MFSEYFWYISPCACQVWESRQISLHPRASSSQHRKISVDMQGIEHLSISASFTSKYRCRTLWGSKKNWETKVVTTHCQAALEFRPRNTACAASAQRCSFASCTFFCLCDKARQPYGSPCSMNGLCKSPFQGLRLSADPPPRAAQ